MAGLFLLAMKFEDATTLTEPYDMRWQRVFSQGVVLAGLGTVLALASIFNRTAMILYAFQLSWLPLSGMVLMVHGLLECLEAKLAKATREFLQNLQVGVLDLVVGGLIVLSAAEDPVRFSMMLAAFLITRGAVRVVMVFALNLPNRVSTIVAGGISIALGLMLWQQWPIADGWFLSLAISIEIALRGWAIMMFALWLRNRQ